MTKEDFKQALLRGQGRCVNILKNEPEKYREVVMWACCNEITFDAQCEGTRAGFVYDLINCYEDKMPFLDDILENLKCTEFNKTLWKFDYICELLSYYSKDGVAIATEALWNKYDELYEFLRKYRLNEECETKDGCAKGNCITEDTGFSDDDLFWERDDFESLCIFLAEDDESVLKIVEDIGKLYAYNDIYDGWDFDGFHYLKVKDAMSLVMEKYDESEYVKRYVDMMNEYEKGLKQIGDNRKKSNESEPDNNEVKENEENMLSNLLIEVVKSFDIDFVDASGWHSAFLEILSMDDKNYKVPMELLYYIYENSYCSCCRFEALKQIDKRGGMTEQMLEEARWDSYEDIREYIKLQFTGNVIN